MTSTGRPSARSRRAAWASGLLATAVVLVSGACGTAGSAAGPVATITKATAGTTAARTTPTGAAAPRPTADADTARAATTAGGSTATRSTAAGAATASDRPPAAVADAASKGLPPVAVQDVSAVSTQDWWVLGTAGGRSLSLARTVDGGRSWTYPALPAGLSGPVAGSPQSPEIAFSSALDGSIVTAGGAYWVTGDGGAHWRPGNPSGAPVMAIAATSDASFALLHTAAGFALARGAAGAVGLTTVLGAGRLTTTIASLATSGRTVVVLSGDRRLISTDDGRTFTTGSGPCTPDLGGQVSVSGTTVVAWCATGMDGSGWISTDGGSRFTAVPGASGANSTAAAPTGSDAALVWADPERGVHLRGTAAATLAGRAMHHVSWVGFTTSTDGFAIAAATTTGPAGLWHTVDGGRSWHPVALG